MATYVLYQSQYDCRRKHIKQNPFKLTIPRKRTPEDPEPPGPFHYGTPEITGGNGYSNIKRAPSYSFGQRLPAAASKPAAKPNAPMFNVRRMIRKGGTETIPKGVISPRLQPPKSSEASPGPAAYQPNDKVVLKRAPKYSIQPVLRPPYQDGSTWTPSPNMYWPPIPGKRVPAFSIHSVKPKRYDTDLPGPGEHDPKYETIEKTKPAFTFGYRRKEAKTMSKTPAPNNYCQHKFNYVLRRGTAPSFGIRHSPYLGKETVWIKSSKLDILASDVED